MAYFAPPGYRPFWSIVKHGDIVKNGQTLVRLKNTDLLVQMADIAGRWVIGMENLDAGRPGAVLSMNGQEFRRSVYVQVRRSRPLSVLSSAKRFSLPNRGSKTVEEHPRRADR
ncbi:MAG: hypothetical protein HC788_11540 [Sphingopyxis sp.]|nr:hypothetical protein [Sphingopyxis sp.]